jgi:hypothetical protein
VLFKIKKPLRADVHLANETVFVVNLPTMLYAEVRQYLPRSKKCFRISGCFSQQ